MRRGQASPRTKALENKGLKCESEKKCPLARKWLPFLLFGVLIIYRSDGFFQRNHEWLAKSLLRWYIEPDFYF